MLPPVTLIFAGMLVPSAIAQSHASDQSDQIVEVDTVNEGTSPQNSSLIAEEQVEICTDTGIQAYIEKLEASTISEAEFEALVSCEDRAVPALAQALEDDSPDTRASAVYALGQIGSDAYLVVPELIEALADEDENVRSLAAYSLGQIGSRAEAAVPTLITSFRDDEETQIVRYQAVLALEQIGSEDAMSALDESIELVNELRTQVSIATQADSDVSQADDHTQCSLSESLSEGTEFFCRQQDWAVGPETQQEVQARVSNVRPVFCSLPGISTILPRCR